MKRILVPCDFSPLAIEAFKFAVDIAWQNEGEVHVLYVIDITFLNGNPTLANSYAFNLNFLKQIEKEADSKFQDMRDKYAPGALQVKFTHQIDSLISGIQNYIDKNEIDLVVIGTHSDHVHTSNADRVVRKAGVPVLVIQKSPAKKIKNIVVPVIPNQCDQKFIGELKKLQHFFGASLHLLWINTPEIFKTDEEALAELHEFARDFELNEYSIHIRSDYNIEEGIRRFAKEIKADMMALGTHRWKGITHMLVGSTTEDIVNRTEMPVWACAL